MLKATDGNTRWMCEIYWKLKIKTPHQCFWHCSAVLNNNFKHILNLALLFLVFSRLGSKSYRFKKSWYSSFVVCKKRQIYCSQRQTQNLWHIKNWFFAKRVYRLKSLAILKRIFFLRSITGCWICLGYFSDLYLV